MNTLDPRVSGALISRYVPPQIPIGVIDGRPTDTPFEVVVPRDASGTSG